MKHIITFLFILSLIAVGFLSLNYVWGWIAIDYTIVVKTVISLLVLILVFTGLAMVFSAAYSRNSSQPNVGKKS